MNWSRFTRPALCSVAVWCDAELLERSHNKLLSKIADDSSFFFFFFFNEGNGKLGMQFPVPATH